MKRLLLLFMILWWLSSATQAATYYLNNLSTTGGNGTTSSITPSDPNRAFATLSACQTAMNTSDANGSGNTVMVYEGNGVTYGNYFESGKNRTSWITYKAADGNHPLLTTIDLPIVAGYSIDPFIVFDGFYIRPGDWWAGDGWGWRAGIRFIRANHIRLLNLDVNGCGATDQTNLLSGSRTSAINITYANDVNINNCKIYTSPRTIPRYGFSEGIAVGYSTNVEINDCNVSEGWIDIATGYNNNITIKDCNFYNPFADGFQFAGDSNLTFENNRVHHFTGVYSPTIVEDPCTTVWSADGKTMVNTSAQWATPGATYIGLGMEIVPVSGTNCLIGEGEIQVGNKLDFQVSAVDLNGMKLTLSRGIADGGQPSEVNYYIKAVTHPDMIQSGSPVFHNINIIRNQFYDWAGQAGNIKPDATTYGGSNLLVENNLFWNTYTSAAEEQSHYLNISNTTGMIFRNNTVIYNLRMWTNDNVHLNNNIISFLENYVTGENYNIFNRAPGFTVGNHSIKLQTGSGSAGYLGWNDVNFTGIFTDYNNGDFTIPGTSTLAINFGDPNNYPLTDILGNSRVFAPDAGDYEYQGGGATSDNPYLEPNIISIDFNDVAVGETAIVKVTFTNTGTLGDWNGVGTLPSPVFTFQSSGTQSETFVIHPSEVCEVNFVCTPTYGNYYIGQTAIMHQTDGNSQNIFMSFDANGIATISVTPISYIDFNSINLCIGSDQLTTKIENNADIVTNGLVTFNDSHFAVIGDANLSLGAKGIGDGNDVCNMLVGFTPDAVGSFYATAAFDVPLGYGATRSVYGSAYTILPTAATNPIPADGATNVNPYVTLSWTADTDTTIHDIYWGEGLLATVDVNYYSLDMLAFNTFYYWRVNEEDSNGNTQGTEWSFTTEEEPNDFVITLTANHTFVFEDGNKPLLVDATTILAHDANFFTIVGGRNELWASDENDNNLPSQIYFDKVNQIIEWRVLFNNSTTRDVNLYLHYGNPGLNEDNDFNTWDPNHVCVQDMVYDYNANRYALNPLLTFTDSTVNAHVGTLNNYFGTVLTLDANSNDTNLDQGIAYDPCSGLYIGFATTAIYCFSRSGNDLTLLTTNSNVIAESGVPVLSGYAQHVSAGCCYGGKAWVPILDYNYAGELGKYARIGVYNIPDLTIDTNHGGGTGYYNIDQNDNNGMPSAIWIDANYIYATTYKSSPGVNNVYLFNYPEVNKADTNFMLPSLYTGIQGIAGDDVNIYLVTTAKIYKFTMSGGFVAEVYDSGGPNCEGMTVISGRSYGLLFDSGTLEDIRLLSYANSGVGTDKWGAPIIKFDATNDYILMPDANDWDFGTGNFSISAWANYSYIHPTLSYGAILARAFSTNTLRFAVSDGSGPNQSIYTKLGATSVWKESNDINVAINTWHHFAFARNGTNWTWYFDGNECKSITVSPVFDMTSATGVYIGLTNTETMNGYLSDIRISNTNRSGNWYKTIFNNENDTKAFWTASTAGTETETEETGIWDRRVRRLDVNYRF